MSTNVDAREGRDVDATDDVEADPIDDDVSAITGDSPLGPGEDTTEPERALWAALDEVEDPHLPLSLVEMAMIYDVNVAGDAATVEITFPCMGCPAYEFIHDDVREACREAGVAEVDIDVVWDPVWSKDMMPEHAKQTLRESGIGI